MRCSYTISIDALPRNLPHLEDSHALRPCVEIPITPLITRDFTRETHPASPQRQHRYLRALKAHLGSRIEIIQGVIARSTPYLRLVNAPPDQLSNTKIRVFQFTEKKTDVNLASDLISDACHERCEQAVLCSNDSDLVGALSAVRRDHPNIVIGLVAPVRDRRQISGDLRKVATWYKALNPAHLATAQLPDRIPGTQLSRPDAWKRLPRVSNDTLTTATRPASGRLDDAKV
jgi:uncharacterized LabA/DUF88 family protein